MYISISVYLLILYSMCQVTIYLSNVSDTLTSIWHTHLSHWICIIICHNILIRKLICILLTAFYNVIIRISSVSDKDTWTLTNLPNENYTSVIMNILEILIRSLMYIAESTSNVIINISTKSDKSRTHEHQNDSYICHNE
jgi:hypothetical protein